MKIDDQITDEEIQHDINRKPVKTSALSSGKIDKHEYMNILQAKTFLSIKSDQSTIIQKPSFLILS